MGAGASAVEVQKGVKEASADELRAAFEGLSPDMKEKVKVALVTPRAPDFCIGQQVECRNADEDWSPGKVVAIEPNLLVKRKEDWMPHVWAEVRPLVEASTAPTADEKLETKADMHAKPVSAKFVATNDVPVFDVYNIDKRKLGEGSYASVSKAKNKATGFEVAVKSIGKRTSNMERLKQEIEIQASMDHPNIAKLWETFEDHRNLYLVMELMMGGELFDRIIERGQFTEKQAAVVMQQAFRAQSYMNDQGVCHRDLKPENYLFLNKDPIESSPMKVVDFGLAAKCAEGETLKTKSGTPYYVAPQVLTGKYDNACDMWSLGVLMYILHCGYPPFYGDTDAETLAKVRLGNFSFNARDWKHVSEDAKHLVRMCLKMNPRDRVTPQQALEHEWFSKMESAESTAADTMFLDAFKQFRSLSKFQKVARQAIAMRAKKGDITKLKEAFLAMDVDGNGTLTLDELKQAIEKAGLEDVPSDLVDILNSIGYQGTNRLSYTEFLAATIDQKVYTAEDKLWIAFRMFDKNGDGLIDLEELKKMLSEGGAETSTEGDEEMSTEERAAAEKMIAEADANGDSKIDFEEFVKMMRAGADL